MSTITAFDIQPFDAPLGAEVLGLDLAEPLGEDAFAALHRAHLDHHVLVYRDQRITPAQQLGFSRRFGRLQIHVLRQFQLPSDPEALIMRSKAPVPNTAVSPITPSCSGAIPGART